LFKSIFDKVILTPNDLNDFITIRGKKVGRAVKTAVSNWLINKTSEYWAIKYGADKKEGFALRDIVRLFHPVGNSAENMNDLFRYLINKDYNDEALPQIRAFKALKSAKTVEEKVAAITEGRLPHEVVTPFANDKAIWEALVPQMPIFAMLKNMATIERHDAGKANKEFIQKLFSDPQRISKSKILPYRFMEAEKQVSTAWMKDSLRDALELSFVNLPEIEGSTAVFLDISGSMGGGYGHPEVLPKAAIFAVALMKKIDDGKLVLFETFTHPMVVSKRDSLLTQAQKIRVQGGTDISRPFDEILQAREKFDNIILITDEQQNQGASVYKTFAQYQAKVNKNTKLFVIDVNAYRNAAFSVNHPNVYYIFGWSDKALDFISYMSKDATGMVKMIEQS
jgi:60 kDa SS-A/Ro ribonucleoprotein